MFAKTKLIAAVSAAGLGLAVAANAAGAPAQTHAKHRSHAEVKILERPSAGFQKSLELAHRRVERQERRSEATTASAALATTTAVSSPETYGVSQSTLDAIAACESGGDPTAVSPDGTYRGKYQFDYGTWASVGGSGDPAAAPESEQDMRAAMLYAEAGSSPWPICGA